METYNSTVDKSIYKGDLSIAKMLILGFLSGAFIAFGAHGSNMAAFNLLSDASTFGLGKLAAGCVFPCGLIMVVLAGTEVFTGNMLMLTGALERKLAISKLLKNWLFVYIGNFLGALFIAWLTYKTGLFGSGGGMLGAVVVKTGTAKVSLSFLDAFLLGIGCNWLVCLAVWMASSAKEVPGKILAIFFPIMVFVISGFEHSIANMYYIPAAIMAKGTFGEQAVSIGASADALDSLNIQGFLVDNLIPVTLGNIVGGGIFVALIFFYVYGRKHDN